MIPSRRRRIAPPVPASYLLLVPSPDEQLHATLARVGLPPPTAEQLQEAHRVFDRLRQLIRQARERWEDEHDVTIVPETTLAKSQRGYNRTTPMGRETRENRER